MSQTCKIEFENANKKTSRTYNVVLFLTDKADEYKKNVDDKGVATYSMFTAGSIPYVLVPINPSKQYNLDLSVLEGDGRANIEMFVVTEPKMQAAQHPVKDFMTQGSNILNPDLQIGRDYYNKFAEEITKISKINIAPPSLVPLNIYDFAAIPIGLNLTNTKPNTPISIVAVENKMEEEQNKLSQCLDKTLEAYIGGGKKNEPNLTNSLKSLINEIKNDSRPNIVENTRLYNFYSSNPAVENGINLKSGVLPITICNTSNVKIQSTYEQDNSLGCIISATGPRFKFTDLNGENSANLNQKYSNLHNSKDVNTGKQLIKDLSRLMVLQQQERERKLNIDHSVTQELANIYNGYFNVEGEKLKTRNIYEDIDTKQLIDTRPKTSFKPTVIKPMKLKIVSQSMLDNNKTQVRDIFSRFFNTKN